MNIHYDAQGLVPAVIQDEATDKVLLVGFMNAEALELTMKTGYTHFYSRSRQRIWKKGEQSGNMQEVRAMYINCEENSLLFKVAQRGDAACHDGYHSCYYRRVLPGGEYKVIAERIFDPEQVYKKTGPLVAQVPQDVQEELEASYRQLYEVYERLRDQPVEGSNTSKMLQKKDMEYLASRVGDELNELLGVIKGEHIHNNQQDDTILEGSQVCYWLMVVAASRFLNYDQFMPHSSVLSGFQESYSEDVAREKLQDCLTLLENRDQELVEQGLHLGFAFVGWACAQAGIAPTAPALADLAQMRKKGLVD